MALTMPKYQEGDFEMTHPHPIYRENANFIIASYVGREQGKAIWEQLWAFRIDNHRFRLCCIPFLTQDIALGDEVETTDQWVIRGVVQRSGHLTFRVWFNKNVTEEVKEDLLRESSNLRVLHEWSSPSFVAFSSPDSLRAESLVKRLSELEKSSVLKYDTGQSRLSDIPIDLLH